MYQKYIKRILDIICALAALIFFGWVYIIVAVSVRIKLGSPVIFKQPRPGIKDKDGNETVFCLYKFRTMTDEKNPDGTLKSDKERLVPFGQKLRDWSLDELPEAINILKGEMSVVGPRPQLVRDMVFMSDEQRKRHGVRPGLTGLAQVRGRNAISWEKKLDSDLEYIDNITFINDLKIVLKTVTDVFVEHEGITEEGMATATDFGDYLLEGGKISKEEYENKQRIAETILKKAGY